MFWVQLNCSYEFHQDQYLSPNKQMHNHSCLVQHNSCWNSGFTRNPLQFQSRHWLKHQYWQKLKHWSKLKTQPQEKLSLICSRKKRFWSFLGNFRGALFRRDPLICQFSRNDSLVKWVLQGLCHWQHEVLPFNENCLPSLTAGSGLSFTEPF